MNLVSLSHLFLIISTIGGGYAYTMRDQLGSDIASFKQSANSLKLVFVEVGDKLHSVNAPILNSKTIKGKFEDTLGKLDIAFIVFSKTNLQNQSEYNNKRVKK